MNFIVKLFFPAVLLLFFSNSDLHPIPWIEFNNKTHSFSENKNKYLDSQIQYYNNNSIDNSSYINHYGFAKMNDHDFAKFFLNYGEKDILSQHELYIYPAFIAYLKTLNGYKNYIIALSHGSNTAMTMDEYLNRAKTLLNSPNNACIDGFVSQEGWLFKYNKITNEFATAKPDGTIETLFRPENGMQYWLDQIKKYKEIL